MRCPPSQLQNCIVRAREWAPGAVRAPPRVLTPSWSRTDVPALLTRCALPFVPLSIFKFATRATLALFSTPAMCVLLTHRLPAHRPPDPTSRTITLQMVFLVLIADLPNHLSF